jgi:DNA-binding transcriptional MerR regulator
MDAVLTIGEVARRTGMNPSTLRAWERRYGLLEPARSTGGHRRYSRGDVDRVEAMLRLIDRGWAVESAARFILEERQLDSRPSASETAATPPLPSEPADAAPYQDGLVDDRPAMRGRFMDGIGEDVGPAGAGPALSPAGAVEGRAGDPRTAERQTTGVSVHERSGVPLLAPARTGGSDPLVADEVDARAIAVAYRAARRLLVLRSPSEAADVLTDLVHELGGEVVPATYGDEDALPIDLSFGTGEPIVPSAPQMSLARMRLEFILPELVEAARHVIELLRAADLRAR